CVAGVVAFLYAVAAFTMVGTHPLEGRGAWQPGLFAVVAGATTGTIGLVSAMKIASLSQGGRAVAEQLGARPVSRQSADPHERRLLHVVEEMSIASGVPVPLVYVLDRETSINAFAAGNGPEDAAIAVTHGALEALSRDELQ